MRGSKGTSQGTLGLCVQKRSETQLQTFRTVKNVGFHSVSVQRTLYRTSLILLFLVRLLMESVQPNLRCYDAFFLKLTLMVRFGARVPTRYWEGTPDLKKKIQKFRKSDNLSKTKCPCGFHALFKAILHSIDLKIS